MKFLKFTLILLTLTLTTACGSGGGDDSDNTPDPNPTVTPTPGPTPTQVAGKTWTLAEILAEPRKGGRGGAARCGGEFGFKKCVCPEDVPSSIRYRPSILECNGNAGAILHDSRTSIFSIVVRDSQNRDRWPAAGSGFGGCSAQEANSENPPAKCSAFKVQDKITGNNFIVHCFGADGYSSIFDDARRLTLKLADIPNSSEDPLERHCLRSGDQPLN